MSPRCRWTPGVVSTVIQIFLQRLVYLLTWIEYVESSKTRFVTIGSTVPVTVSSFSDVQFHHLRASVGCLNNGNALVFYSAMRHTLGDVSKGALWRRFSIGLFLFISSFRRRASLRTLLVPLVGVGSAPGESSSPSLAPSCPP